MSGKDCCFESKDAETKIRIVAAINALPPTAECVAASSGGHCQRSAAK